MWCITCSKKVSLTWYWDYTAWDNAYFIFQYNDNCEYKNFIEIYLNVFVPHKVLLNTMIRRSIRLKYDCQMNKLKKYELIINQTVAFFWWYNLSTSIGNLKTWMLVVDLEYFNIY